MKFYMCLIKHTIKLEIFRVVWTVAGVKLTQEKLRTMMLARIEHCMQDEVVCYLLDDGGYIILSSEKEEDREVMKHNRLWNFIIPGFHVL